ncbi:nuclear pore complex protein GP210 [Capsella rubella]|uniref:nuclear pore complex protein GP210 n=1 Tax=Capsella rubella TaxID=81985 RepID=UPI000CD57F31|nr:nuclear pore complex protein GP210 [Capsella rubella]
MTPPSPHASLKEAPDHVTAPSFALLLGRLSVSETGKVMNITSEVNNVIISIVEKSDVQIHWHEKSYLSMSLWEDFGIAQSQVKKQSIKDQIIVTLSSAGQRVGMSICYEIDESQIPTHEKILVYCMIIMFIFSTINVKIATKYCSNEAATTKIDEKVMTRAECIEVLKKTLCDMNKRMCEIEKLYDQE